MLTLIHVSDGYKCYSRKTLLGESLHCSSVWHYLMTRMNCHFPASTLQLWQRRNEETESDRLGKLLLPPVYLIFCGKSQFRYRTWRQFVAVRVCCLAEGDGCQRMWRWWITDRRAQLSVSVNIFRPKALLIGRMSCTLHPGEHPAAFVSCSQMTYLAVLA